VSYRGRAKCLDCSNAAVGNNTVSQLRLKHTSGRLTLPNHTQATGTVMWEGSVNVLRAYALEADDLTFCCGCPREWLGGGRNTLTGAK